jgi:hypothetical protein
LDKARDWDEARDRDRGRDWDRDRDKDQDEDWDQDQAVDREAGGLKSAIMHEENEGPQPEHKQTCIHQVLRPTVVGEAPN